MPVFEEFPYTNFHELNLDWILAEIKKLRADFAEFVGGHTITYADPIQWSILTAYPAYTIVLDNLGNAYMTIQDTPAGTPLTDTDYWMQIGNFYGYVDAMLDTVRHYSAFEQPKYYINSTTGSDDNPGTAALPFATIDKFMALSDQYSAIECHITGAGDYRVTGRSTIAGLDVRIYGDVPDINIYLHGDDSVDYYHVLNSHLRLQDVTVYVQNGGNTHGNIIGVNAVIALNNVALPYGGLECNGGELIIETASVQYCTVHNGYGRFYKCRILNTDPDKNAYDLVNSMIEFRAGNNYTTALTADGTTNAVISARACHLAIRSYFVSSATTGQRYYAALSASFCTILMDASTSADYGQYTVTPGDTTRNIYEIV